MVAAAAGQVEAGPAHTPGPADITTRDPADTATRDPADTATRDPADIPTPGPADTVTPGPADTVTPGPGPGSGGYSAASLRWCSVALLWLVSR
ncbi:hypothetical protein SNE510_41080 [Streptomyces sp. NE5-10]|nr:hypothetical protein SNE510_41080 [Streptomyces sp. NE5-10]